MTWRAFYFPMGVTILLVIGAIIGALYCDQREVKINEWGDFLGGLAAVLALVWLIAGHLDNQRQIQETKADLDVQFALGREAIGELAKIAAGAQIEIKQVLADARPIFEFKEYLGNNLRNGGVASRPKKATVVFENTGGAVNLSEVIPMNGNVIVNLKNPGLCKTNDRVEIGLESEVFLKDSGEICFNLLFEDIFRVAGWAQITFQKYGTIPTVTINPGRPNV